MDFKSTNFEDAFLITPRVFEDDRGCFYESWNQQLWCAHFRASGLAEPSFVQDNHSISAKGVLRGLHFQKAPHQQGKLVQCMVGEIFDVIVDLRPDSASFKCWQGFYLSSQNKSQLWVPSGFGHGFLALTDEATVVYKVTEAWNPQAERTLHWRDPDLAIDWPLHLLSSHPHAGHTYPILSSKDSSASRLSELLQDIVSPSVFGQ